MNGPLWMTDGLSSEKAEPQTIMIDTTYLKAHRTASILRSKRGSTLPDQSRQRRREH